MSELAEPEGRISKAAGCEIVLFELRAGSAGQILPQKACYRFGAAPYAKHDRFRVVRNDGEQSAPIRGEQDLVITGWSSEQNR